MSKIQFVDIHTHQQANLLNTFSVVQYYDGLDIQKNYFSVSIHPKDLVDVNTINWEEISALATHKNCIAIGETGLDKFVGDIDAQTKLFIKHIELANKVNKPLIIHCVKAFEECFKILKNQNLNSKVLFHGFNKNIELAKQILNKNYYLSLGSNYLKKYEENIDFYRNIKFQNIFLETDNRMELIEDIYSRYDENLQISKNDFVEYINKNLKQFLS